MADAATATEGSVHDNNNSDRSSAEALGAWSEDDSTYRQTTSWIRPPPARHAGGAKKQTNRR